MLCVSAWAVQSRKVTASAGSPIPTAYSNSDSQSLIWSGIGQHKHLHINNTTSSAIACMNGIDMTTSAPNPQSAAISEEIFIPATTQYIFDEFRTSKKFFCRSDSGSTITSGQLLLHVY